jgi:hypothetical protein
MLLKKPARDENGNNASGRVASDRARGTSAVARDVSVVATKRIDRQKSRLNRRGFQNRSHVVVDVLLRRRT